MRSSSTSVKPFDDTEETWGKYLLAFGIVYILDHYTITHKYYNSKGIYNTRQKSRDPAKMLDQSNRV